MKLIKNEDLEDLLLCQREKLVGLRDFDEMFLYVLVARVDEPGAHELVTELSDAENIVGMQPATNRRNSFVSCNKMVHVWYSIRQCTTLQDKR